MVFSRIFSEINRKYIILLAVFLISLSLRLSLLDKRWINPDEGAHLMDAVLAMDGKVPGVDFDSRQPLYVYALAGVLKIAGTSYVSGRLLPLICSILTGILIFLIARALFDEKVGLLSSVIYLMMPLELFNSVIVKTQPLVILLTCLSFYFVIRFLQHGKTSWLMIAGAFASMGFFVRESALIIPLAVLGLLVIVHRGRVLELCKALALFFAGYAAVPLLILGYYANYVSYGQLLTSGLSPIGFLTWAVIKLFSILGIGLGSGSEVSSHPENIYLTKAYIYYYEYLRQVLYLHSFLFIGLAYSAVGLFVRLFSKRDEKWFSARAIPFSLLYLWVFSLFAAYAFYFSARGFYIDYFREFLPPLVIVFSAWLRYSISFFDKPRALERFVIAGLCASAVLFCVQVNYRDMFLGVGFHACLAIAVITFIRFVGTFESLSRRLGFMCISVAIITLILLSRSTALKPYFSGAMPEIGIALAIYIITWTFMERRRRLGFKAYAKFVGNSVALASFIVSLSFSAFLLDLPYESIWSPESVEKTAQYLRSHTKVGDEVMSGAVIWELQAQRRPFQMISHPLSFLYEIPKKEKEAIAFGLAKYPPKVIILDGYTEKTYVRHMPWLTEFIARNYELKEIAGPAKYPVKVHQLRNVSN